MFSNTGIISFCLYLFFIIIGLLSIFIVYKLIKKGDLADNSLNKFVEYFKWVIVTLAISTVTLIISDLFKEREQDIKELEYFDKYVKHVINEDSALVRLQLSKYLSIVAPNGEMKKSWANYYDTIKREYQEYLMARKDTTIKDSNSKPSLERLEKIDENKEKVKLFETPLSSISKGVEEAKKFEEIGFKALLERDINTSITAFNQGEEAWHGYHDLFGIVGYLTKNRDKLLDKNSTYWITTYRTILSTYSWKMPVNYKIKLQEELK
ncbi:hypothetical protein [Pedobacter mendelii]|uniref:DUF4760 domain-containing protein n=1 Tax=Pedobacter mendelii TaxID=1908240 RepID=A0ABQ2BGV6_9SPHI|nr:hypothetical protein [Pedobacter mendelii]GGI24677.1 hypothetical protein GCM10008119_13850 [Pedobacter mendelii]